MQTVIKQSFSRHCQTYNKRAIIQKKVALDFLSFKNDLSGKGIDLGCGTGFLSSVFLEKDIVGVDISKSMTKEYFNQTKKASITADIQHLPFKNESFDFAISSFALHWTNIDDSFSEIYRILKKNGKFIFSIPIEPSLEEFFFIVGKNFTFPLKQKILKDLYFFGFKINNVFEKTYPLCFKNGKDALEFFKYTGTAVNKNTKSLKEKIKNYKKLISHKHQINTKFVILFVEAIKN